MTSLPGRQLLSDMKIKLKFPLILQCCSERLKDSLQAQIKYLYFMKFCLHP